MKFLIMFLEVPDFSAIQDDLVRFKQNLQMGANVTVIDVEQPNYDFLYNSLIEKANQEQKRDTRR
jgi:ABC-type long-subunit fatty acid transport system fused permease/ATPase subunit